MDNIIKVTNELLEDASNKAINTAAELRKNKINTKVNQNTVASKSVNNLTELSPVGSLNSAISNNFYGINHRQTPGAIQINKDVHGLTFFTRPELNLTSENIRNVRILTPLLTTEPNSIQRAIRCTLDPLLAKRNGSSGQALKTDLIDEDQAFIPLLTNTLLSISGWPDKVAPNMTSEAGAYQEVFGLVDGVTIDYSSYDISASFRNIPGDPITALISTWIDYAALVYQGMIVPYFSKIIENEIDYNTRIYRLVLDTSKTRVQKIACTGASFPVNSPIGAAFNYEHDKPLNSSNDQISVTFKSFGACYQDDILISEFNQIVCKFNKGMVDTARLSQHVQVPMEALGIFNNRGYPRINPDTYELEWWVKRDEYDSKINNRS